MLRFLIVGAALLLFPLSTIAQQASEDGVRDCAVEPAAWFSQAERWAWKQICQGRTVQMLSDEMVKDGQGPGWQVTRCSAEDSTPSPYGNELSARFLHQILKSQRFRAQVEGGFVDIRCAQVSGRVDLTGMSYPFSIYLSRSSFDDSFLLAEGQIDGALGLAHNTFAKDLMLYDLSVTRAVYARSMRVRGRLSAATSEVALAFDLSDGNFDGDIILSGARVGYLAARRIHSWSKFGAEGMQVRGNILFKDAVFEGDLSLRDVTGGRNLDLEGVRLPRQFDGGRLKLGAGVYGRSAIIGSVKLWDARIAGDVSFDRSSVRDLDLSQSEIGGDVWLTNGGRYGGLNLSGAKVAGEVNMAGGLFDPAPLHSSVPDRYSFAGAHLGTLRLWDRGTVPAWAPNAGVDLSHASVDRVIARFPSSWKISTSSDRLQDIALRNGALAEHLPEKEADRPYPWFLACADGPQEELQAADGSVYPFRAKSCMRNEPVWPVGDAFELVGLQSNGLRYRTLDGAFLYGGMNPTKEQSMDQYPYDVISISALDPFLSSPRVVSDTALQHEFWDLVTWVRAANHAGGDAEGVFYAQPYEELARMFDAQGRKFEARFVNVVKSIDRVFSDHGLWFVFGLVWGIVWGVTTGFGNFPELALFWFALLVVWGMSRSRLIRDERLARRSDRFWFSLENSLPLIEPSPDHQDISYRDAGPWFFHFQKVTGFLLATVLVGALTLG